MKTKSGGYVSDKESGQVRIVVFSDSHGDASRLEKAIFQQPKAELFLYLGDGEWDLDGVKPDFPGRDFRAVSGNCDFASALPAEDEILACGKRIFYTHGHKYGVKSGTTRIIEEAVRREADILLFGHTHEAFTAYENGLYIMNPGSLGHPADGRPTYGIIDLTKAGIVTSVVELYDCNLMPPLVR